MALKVKRKTQKLCYICGGIARHNHFAPDYATDGQYDDYDFRDMCCYCSTMAVDKKGFCLDCRKDK